MGHAPVPPDAKAAGVSTGRRRPMKQEREYPLWLDLCWHAVAGLLAVFGMWSVVCGCSAVSGLLGMQDNGTISLFAFGFLCWAAFRLHEERKAYREWRRIIDEDKPV